MSWLHRRLACFALVALLVPGATVAAYASASDDQARARSMLLLKSDLLPGFVARGEGRNSAADLTRLQCKGIASSSIQPTGSASTRNFSRPPIFVSSHATIFGTPAEADAVWRDFSSNAGRACLVKFLRQAFVGDGTLVSFGKISFPRVGQRTLAFRLVAKVRGINAYLDWVMINRSRAIAIVLAGGAGTGVVRSYVATLAQIVAGRMKAGLRGE